MAQFLNELVVHIKDDDSTWVLDKDLIYKSDIQDNLITVPEGFETDFASVPRLPLAYWMMGNVAHKAAVVHDYLYRTGSVPKEVADKIFREAMETTGVWAWRRWPMYWAVSLFGGPNYKPQNS